MKVLEYGKLLKMEDLVAVEDREEATLRYSIRGYHVYRAIWSAALGEILQCERESDNLHDRYAVSVMRHGTIIGHLPRRISCVSSLFLRRGGQISCKVTGSRRYSADLSQGGLEIPCDVTFSGNSKEIKKLLKLLANNSKAT